MRRGATDQGSVAALTTTAAAVGGCVQMVQQTRAQGTTAKRQRRGSGHGSDGRLCAWSLDSGALHETSRAVTQDVGALGRGDSRLRKEGNGNERGGRNLFIKLLGQLKGLEVAEEP